MSMGFSEAHGSLRVLSSRSLTNERPYKKLKDLSDCDAETFKTHKIKLILPRVF